MSFILHLPFPPSLNDANAIGKNRRTGQIQVYSNRGKTKFFRDADALFLAQKRGLERISGPFTYHLILNEGMRHGNADGDNRGKYCLDYLQKIGLIDNDKYAAGGSWSWGACEFGAMISVYPHRVQSNQDGAEAA